MIPSLASLPYFAAALLAVASLALTTAEHRDPEADPFKRLNLMLAQVIAGIALAVTGLAALYFYGLIWPTLAAILLFVAYNFAVKRNLRSFYRFNYFLGIAATICVVAALSNITLTDPVAQ